MLTLPQSLGAMAQALGMSQDALEKNLIAHLTKLDKGVQDVYTLLGSLSNSLAAAPGGAAQSGGTAAGLISPAAIAALPPLQTLDSELSDLLVKLEPSIKLLLQLRDAAEKAASSNETLTSSLAAMAVAARGVSNLMSGLRANGGPLREPEDAMRTAVLAGSATQRAMPGATNAKEPASASIYHAVPPGVPASDRAHYEPTSVYSVSLPDEVKYNSPLEELYSRPQAPALADSSAQILAYLARFEPILQGIDTKCEKILKNGDDLFLQAGNASLGISTGVMGGAIATGEVVAMLPIAASLAVAGFFLKLLDPETRKQIEERLENMEYQYINKFYVRPNPNREDPAPLDPEITNPRIEHSSVPTTSAIEAIPPQYDIQYHQQLLR